jgi:diphthamide biosynthesis protein 2
MTIPSPSVAPVLSTPDDRLFKADDDIVPTSTSSHLHLDDNEFRREYEIDRTIAELRQGGYKRVALQFPDELLGDSSRVYSLIHQGINTTEEVEGTEKKVYILADTSYAACCVDEIAAEHACADVLVHYGRSCLSPTARLPVIYVFTSKPLSLSQAVDAFTRTYPERDSKIILMADVTYASHCAPLYRALKDEYGYTQLFQTEIIHNPASPLPNRSIPEGNNLKSWSLFHLMEPLPSLVLVLASRVDSINCFSPTESTIEPVSATLQLRRRYAVLSHAKSAVIIGILVNTLNVKNYLPMIASLKRQIRDAGRKSYLVVIGKVNVEKVANFAEVEVWVGVGCWEQGVVGGTEGKGWYRPIVTPWELGIALGQTEWTGSWIADFAEVLRLDSLAGKPSEEETKKQDNSDCLDSDEDAPPEFDLRTGRYTSTSRPLGINKQKTNKKQSGTDNQFSSLALPPNREKELIATGGVLSPAGRFLKENRTWKGLGSDYINDDEYEKGALVEEGRSGVARGYVVGKDGDRH